METLYLLIALGVLVVGVGGFLVARTRTRRSDPFAEPGTAESRANATDLADLPDLADLADPSGGLAEDTRADETPAQPPETGQATAPAAPESVPTEVPPELVDEIEEALEGADAVAVRPSFRDRLARTRGRLAQFLTGLGGGIEAETWDDLEAALLQADVGVDVTTDLLDATRDRVKAEGVTDGDGLVRILKEEMKRRLVSDAPELRLEPSRTNVWLFVGVNGVGKTTTIGKLGRAQIAEGRSVVMAAGDTFRAAAAEQLATWAERSGADFVRGEEGGDPSSVIYDSIQKAAASGADLVLADTAGRLHTKTNLMEELAKVRRVAAKDPGYVSEVLLVIDASTGQNGLVQARQFAEAVAVTGVVLTKLDGSAKGGIVLAIRQELDLPIKLVGLGEGIDDLVEFNAEDFVEALFD